MTSQHKLPLLGISMGDPGGIGPEVCLKALAEPAIHDICRPMVVGDLAVLEKALGFSGVSLDLHPVAGPEEGLYRPGVVDLLDLSLLPAGELRQGVVSAKQGDASFQYVRANIALAMEGRLDGNVTGPLNKAALNAAGHHFSGHTEIYAHFTGTRDYSMMLCEGGFRVAHVSTHVALRKACDLVKKERVLGVIELANQALVRLGIAKPRLAVAGLNPHCGEEGLFGDEDSQEVAPAVAEARAKGLAVEGPIPADTVFSKMRGGMYDLVVVMYHDQGHIPTKLIGFQYDEKTGRWGGVAGVNVTLGLPIIRTSVDHGTAFEIAGRGEANPESMGDAIRMAAIMAGAKA